MSQASACTVHLHHHHSFNNHHHSLDKLLVALVNSIVEAGAKASGEIKRTIKKSLWHESSFWVIEKRVDDCSGFLALAESDEKGKVSKTKSNSGAIDITKV